MYSVRTLFAFKCLDFRNRHRCQKVTSIVVLKLAAKSRVNRLTMKHKLPLDPASHVRYTRMDIHSCVKREGVYILG